MAETTESLAEAEDEEQLPRVDAMQGVVNRVLTLSIFFVGIGVDAIAGVALRQTELFTA